MDFVWAGNRDAKNVRLFFKINQILPCDTLRLAAADAYQIFLDGSFAGYGPERTAAGYARVREQSLVGVREIEIRVLAVNEAAYQFDLQKPFFAAELLKDGELLYTTRDFACFTEAGKKTDTTRYSYQRGFVEAYELGDKSSTRLDTYAVEAPILLSGVGETCNYGKIELEYVSDGAFCGFERVLNPWWEEHVDEGRHTVNELFLKKISDGGYKEIIFRLPSQRTGFMSFKLEAESDTEIFVLFEEILENGKWSCFRRSDCNEIVMINAPCGSYELMTAEPYTLQFMKIVYKGALKISPSLILYENDRANCVSVSGDERIVKIFNAAKSTFKQNAVDIYVDCPGRERAGWLCDSYFTAKAELLFTGKSDMESCFLENFILASTPEIPDGMLPMCFPAEHTRHKNFIPNWAMWYVTELGEYLERTGDRELIERARDKVYKLIGYFEGFRNEDGLLENLDSWVFVEWSISNHKDYVCGVNYPSNMLFAYMLDTAARLYKDGELARSAEKIRAAIVKCSWNGEFFADNSTRDECGRLVRRDDHVSETCQYYALFTGVPTSAEFKKKMLKDFGPLRPQNAYPEIGRSNMFIGNYLRFFWLISLGERERVVEECLDYFRIMAEKTGTLWENDKPSASCNHGFASAAAVILLNCLVGYKTTKNGAPVFEKDFTPSKKYELDVSFDYNN